MKGLRVLVLIAGTVLAGCASDSRIVREAPAALADFAPQAQVRTLWSVDLGALAGKREIKLTPSLDGDVIYAADAQGRVSAHAADSGRRLWETALDVDVTGATGAGQGMVVVGTKKGTVIALAQTNGERLWSSRAPSEILSPAVVHAGVVVVQTVDGKLTGLSAKDGRRLWLYGRSEPALSLRGTSTPVIAGDSVLTGFASGKIVALHLKDGRLLWELAVAQPRGRNEIERLVDIDVPPLIVRDTLFAASYQGKIVAVDLRTGRMSWSRDASTFSGMDADRANVYLTDEKGNVIALDQRTGASLWKQEKLRARSLNAPTFFDGHIVVGDFEGYVHWLAREDGRFIARSQVGGAPIRSRAMVGSDTLYVVNQDGVLTALQLVKR
jgi:outer membrane protein assembly factor BamB